ncbi:glutathione-regulated potassium-efflux system ancillary protein KefG [Aliivibrio fischeri]|uniref:glutathione-regulated potassium-efflux system ancillary protein KefG n=1 Tax=Aliivibrio fischeri TaxID=668 RepID=UPI0007C48148|nr:glutathione-regulated potassium-efflux system ancillary protein KefG [Aliivibrio fischeri]MCE7536843.1 glutathione-regulated potassium-efflux system ancillary protein KefG [Aliivibrio fischeri]MCE7560441.1 glutathione-regulated potassium-efflux system ancillary protein KefG [Aliivibrio fischeri]MCE7578032.1 glutathione-regulated potassium-efflux system ancillary protein KefG [Aliivibrio fischeri]MCE7590420.1 glutathione-regulated potassium-efflux system ancillary protein KefG [Aliivibrio fis
MTQLPKILVILAHPDPEQSIANKAILSAYSHLEHVTVHDLYAHYPDFFIDVVFEHELLAQHDIIIFQHPLYLYSCPALLKEWMDCVLGKGFAYGNGDALKGKQWRSVITAGGIEEAFSKTGYNQHSMDDILIPFKITAALCQMEWLPPSIQYWARKITVEKRQQYIDEYKTWLLNPKGGI